MKQAAEWVVGHGLWSVSCACDCADDGVDYAREAMQHRWLALGVMMAAPVLVLVVLEVLAHSLAKWDCHGRQLCQQAWLWLPHCVPLVAAAVTWMLLL